MSKQDAQRRNVFMMDPEDIVVIGHDTKDGPEHALWDPRIKLPLDENMVKNIQVYGVLEPILAMTDGDKTLTVDGRRRVLHAREAAKRQKKAGEEVVKVPVFFKKGEDQVLFGISRSANAMRTDDGPMTNARNAQRMIDMGASEAETAVAFGVTPASIRAWVSLLSLAPKVKTAVEKREIGIGAATALVKLTKEEQESHLEELRAAGIKPTAEKVNNSVRAKQGKTATITPKVRIEKALAQLEKVAPTALGDYDAENPLVEALNKICKALTGKALGKLLPPEPKEPKAVEAPAEDAQVS